MINVDIPDFGRIDVAHIVCDYNGTLAVDGQLIAGVSAAFEAIDAAIHVITADTFGVVREQLATSSCELTIAPPGNQAAWKLDYIKSLGVGQTAAIGNGRNDRMMLKEAALGIALIQAEGAARETIESADVVCSSILDALAFFSKPQRLVATLRS